MKIWSAMTRLVRGPRPPTLPHPVEQAPTAPGSESGGGNAPAHPEGFDPGARVATVYYYQLDPGEPVPDPQELTLSAAARRMARGRSPGDPPESAPPAP